jgi:NDP-sugar pyrophosphorylase family protein
MIGIILCGGYSKRLRSIIGDIPKALLELKDGYTILDKQLLGYSSAGFNRVFLLAGYQSEKIRQKCGDRYKGLDIEYINEKESLGTLNAIRLILEETDEDLMVSDGDVVADINLKRMNQKFQRLHPQVLIFIARMQSPYDIVRFKDRCMVSSKGKQQPNCFINGGYYCLSRNILSRIKDFKMGNIEKTIFPRLRACGRLAYYKEEGKQFWATIDRIEDIENVKKEYLNRMDKPWGHEKLLKLTNKRMEKLLFIMAGYRTSFHYHKVKEETFYVVKGAGWIEFENGRQKKFREGTKIHIKPGVIHGTVASKNTLIHEVSTPYLEDVVRIKDFYGAR